MTPTALSRSSVKTLLFRASIRDCPAGASCFSTFETFLKDTEKGIYPSLFNALDTNHDGRVDSKDPACKLNVLGFSWGGVASFQLIQALTHDSRVSIERAVVDRLIVLDPFQPATSPLVVPPEVKAFWEYRHSTAPSTDCSAHAPLGPYLGITPRCTAAALCVDYDYSLSPSVPFMTPLSGPRFGAEVGHCDVPLVAHLPVVATLRGQPYDNVPATVPLSSP